MRSGEWRDEAGRIVESHRLFNHEAIMLAVTCTRELAHAGSQMPHELEALPIA